MNKDELSKKWAKVIAKAWADERFKEKLLKNPAQTLKEMGIDLPAGQKIEIHSQSDKIIHLVIPQKPKGEMNAQELKNVSGAFSTNWTFCGETHGG
jgi:hypothetical protein